MEKYLLDLSVSYLNPSDPILSYITNLIKRMKVMYESTIFEKYKLLQQMKDVCMHIDRFVPKDFPKDSDYMDDQYKDLFWSMIVIRQYIMDESGHLEQIIEHDLREISYGKNKREYEDCIITDYAFWFLEYKEDLDRLIKCVDDLIAQPYIRK